MRLIRIEVLGDDLYKNSHFVMDLYATDRVVAGRDELKPYGVVRVGDEGNIYTQNVVGISGVNASGKTTSINLLEFAVRYLAITFVMRSDRFSWDSAPAKLERQFELKLIFWHEGQFYALDARLQREGEGDRQWYRVDDEYLFMLKEKRPTKRIFSSFDEFLNRSELIIHRNALDGEAGALTSEQKTFLRDDMSVAAAVSGKRIAQSRVAIGRLEEESYDTAVVHAFDNSIERLSWDDVSEVYHLKFHGEGERSVSRRTAEAELSTGTIFGTELVQRAVYILRQGGIMIVDEIERGLNKSLVKTIIELFLSSSTNPNGAQLVFTTHYPEILDFLPRKDDVYLLVRDGSHQTSVIKYSDRVSRIENKKSEVVLSNFIRGTVPDYPDISNLRAYVQRSVEGKAGE